MDYTGKVMPCCNLRSDFPEHRDFIVGDLSDGSSSIFDIYAGRLTNWRHSMIGFDEKKRPCTTCRHRDMSNGLLRSESSRMKKHLGRIGHGELMR